MQLGSPQTGITLITYGAEQGANQGPLDVTVTNVSTLGQIKTVMHQQGLFSGRVVVTGKNVTILYSTLSRSGEWAESVQHLHF